MLGGREPISILPPTFDQRNDLDGICQMQSPALSLESLTGQGGADVDEPHHQTPFRTDNRAAGFFVDERCEWIKLMLARLKSELISGAKKSSALVPGPLTGCVVGLLPLMMS